MPRLIFENATPYNHVHCCQQLCKLDRSPLENALRPVRTLEIQGGSIKNHFGGRVFDFFVLEPNAWKERKYSISNHLGFSIHRNRALAELMSHFPNVKTVNLVRCVFFKDPGIEYFVDNHKAAWKLIDCKTVSTAIRASGIEEIYTKLVIQDREPKD